MHPIAAFILGLFIGGTIGAFVMCLMANASRCEKLIEDIKSKERNAENERD